MSNEEFQKLVLEKLSNLETGQKKLEIGQENINKRLDVIETKLDGIEERVTKNSEFIHNVVQIAKEVDD